MAENVSLSSAVRANLLALLSTTDLINRTQGRLSTGLRVASAVDDPVAFFQAKSLNDRADDFQVKKRGIDQGISTVTSASDAVTGIENLVQQLKGLVLTAKSATTNTEVANLVTQFNDLRTQINNLASDASYQGLNLVNGTGSTLTVNFSNDTASVLSVGSYDIRTSAAGLAIAKLSAYTATDGIAYNRGFISAGTLTAANSTDNANYGQITVTIGGQSAQTVSAGDTFTFSYDGLSILVNVASSNARTAGNLAAGAAVITAGTYLVGSAFTFSLVSAGVGAVDLVLTQAGGGGVYRLTATSVNVSATEAISAVGVGYTTEFNSRITNLDSALTTLRSRAQSLGSNVALLQTRLDFTKAYANTLSTGAGKLTLADLNEEGANLLALQTRQQLGIQSLAFAGKAEQTILTLFR